jgi:hypothetical protein
VWLISVGWACKGISEFVGKGFCGSGYVGAQVEDNSFLNPSISRYRDSQLKLFRGFGFETVALVRPDDAKGKGKER